jgi:REP element-mobilizing transposase RayT
LPSSGRDYMIHSRRTEDGFTLSLIFAGNMPLRIIRNQSDKLLRALSTIPELPAPSQNLIDALQERELQALEAEAAKEIEAAIETTADIAREHGEEHTRHLDQIAVATPSPAKALAPVKAAYTFVWMTRDADINLDAHVIRLLARELESQLTEHGWTVENLQVYEDYIYLMADVPGEATSNTIIAELKQRAAWIAHSIDSTLDPDQLWADGYCVLAPGREMDTDEIQRYIHFARL